MGAVKYPGFEKYINDDPKHKAILEAYLVDMLCQANVDQLKKMYEWYSSEISNKEIPEQNLPDWDNDTINVLRAKVLAIREAYHGED